MSVASSIEHRLPRATAPAPWRGGPARHRGVPGALHGAAVDAHSVPAAGHDAAEATASRRITSLHTV